MNDQKQKYDRESYSYWKSQHRCVSCHKQDAFTMGGRVRCAECTTKARESKISYRERNRDRLSAAYQDWYSRMKADQRCVRCGRSMEGKYTTCTGCRARQRAADAERSLTKGKIPKSIAVDCGICGICNKRQVTEGRRTCSACYEQNMKNLEKANAVKDNTDHPWRRIAHAEAERRAAV